MHVNTMQCHCQLFTCISRIEEKKTVEIVPDCDGAASASDYNKIQAYTFARANVYATDALSEE